MSEFMRKVNSPTIYLIAAVVVLFVLVMAVVFFIKAYKEGIRIGMDKGKIKKVVVSSVVFTAVPSVGLLIGLISLAGSIGVPTAWMKLSMIGSLQYQTMAADATAKAAGYSALSGEYMDGNLLVTILFVMSIGMIWATIFCLFGLKKYQKNVLNKAAFKENRWGGIMSSSLFMGMVSVFVCASFADVRKGSFISLIVALVSAGFMAVFTWLIKKRNVKWLESFALSFAMILGMTTAVVLTKLGVS